MKKKVILSVTNDLYTDPRVDKVCRSLLSFGFDVLLIGRKYANSPALPSRPYPCKRMHLLFRKGPLFYAEYNLRLFFYLLFLKSDILVANDLDTLLPNLLVSKLKKKKLVYDSHEYFCGLLSIANKPLVKKIWTNIETFCFPKLENIMTVSQSIADKYKETYHKNIAVVRNIPSGICPPVTETRESLGLPKNKSIILLQGNGINQGRGAEELVSAMQFIEEALLLIIGSGTIILKLKKMITEISLSDKVRLIDRMNPDKLFNYTYLADIGISIDKDLSPNLHYSLPNKIFEYIKAETPIIVSNLPERALIVHQYQIGIIINDFDKQTIANAINEMINDKEQYVLYKENCKKAAKELRWENEERVLREVYGKL